MAQNNQTENLSPKVNDPQTFEDATIKEDKQVRSNLSSPTIRNAKLVNEVKYENNTINMGINQVTNLGFTTFNNNIRPTDDNEYNCGTIGKAWEEVHCYDVIDYCHNYDKLDAISLLKDVKAKGNTDKLDHSTLPDFIQKSGGRSLNRYVDLMATAIKQLEKRLSKLEKK